MGVIFIKTKKKLLIIITIFLILFVLSGSVSAINDNNTTKLSQNIDNEINLDNDNILTTESSTRDINASLKELENNEILKTTVNGGTFKDIQDAIDSTDSGGVIELNGDYTVSEEQNQIEHNKDNLVIIGKNDAILNTQGQANIFYITGNNITLKNLKIINHDFFYGSVVYWWGNNGIINNCTFINNTGQSSFHTIHWRGSNGIVNSSSFINNNAQEGSAIYWEGINGNVINCKFTKNTVSIQGGAIYWKGSNGNVKNCSFMNNTGESGGGAIYWNGEKGNVTNCSFENNIAFESGGAIYWEGINGNVTNCSFENNTAFEIGGAIYWENAKGTITHCSFKNNTAPYGGAIQWAGANGNIINCNFTKNTASGNGGAINWNDKGTISDCNFKNNTATNGGAIHLIGDEGIVRNCNFTNNLASGNGGAIHWENEKGNINYCTFKNNTAKLNGGAIYWENAKGNITHSTFKNNTAKLNGGAIYWNNDGTISNSNFTNNCAYEYGSAIYIYNNSKSAISYCNFTNSQVELGETTIYNNGNLSLEKNNINTTYAEIINNNIITSKINVTVLQNITHLIDTYKVTLNATIFDDNGNMINDRHVNFTIQYNDEINTVKAEFKNSQYEVEYNFTSIGVYLISMQHINSYKSVHNGIIIFTRGTFSDLQNKIKNAESELNLTYNFTYSHEIDGEDYINGVVINKTITINGNGLTISGRNQVRIFNIINSGATVILDKINFINSTTNGNGAAIYSNSKLTVNNSVFDSNNLGDRSSFGDNYREAGVIFATKGSELTIFNSNFTNNIKNYNYGELICGGAIASLSNKVLIDNCRFINNIARLGGAIILKTNKDAVVVINNSKFTNNTAYQGGAIFVQNISSLTINNTLFDTNYVKFNETSDENVNGAAIYTINSINITKSNFTNNRVDYTGAAVYIDSNSNSEITFCEFSDNLGNNKVNAITIHKGTLSLANNTIYSGLAEIIVQNDAIIVSKIKIVVMENKTYNSSFKTVKLNAIITDDYNNRILDEKFFFVIGEDTVVAIYNQTSKLYEGLYTPTKSGEHNISMSYNVTNNLNVSTAKIIFVRSLSDIQRYVQMSNEWDTIILDGDYSYIDTFDSDIIGGIVIDKNIVINGNGTVISGSNLARLFKVSSPYTLTLINVTITNATVTNGNGAGVYVEEGAKFVANYVNFTNNTAQNRGGAIYSEGTVELNNTFFDRNDIINRTVNKNNGGATIYNLGGTLLVINSIFTNNLKNLVISGANGQGDLINGIITASGTNTILNSVFENNSGCYGADIYFSTINKTLADKLVIDGCNFTNAKSYAGSIYIENAKTDISNSKFENYVAYDNGSADYTVFGGVICAMYTDTSLNIVNSTFINNTAPKGSAILAQGIQTVSIKDSKFINNSATSDKTDGIFGMGGAISIESINVGVEINNSTFINNTATRYGGAIAIDYFSDVTTKISNSNFSGNSAINGNAIQLTNGSLELFNNTISKTNADIYNKGGKITSLINITVLENKTFVYDTFEIALNATVCDDNGNLINDVNFNFTIDDKTTITAIYNVTINQYEAMYNLTAPGSYIVSLTYPVTEKLELYNGTIKCTKGSFFDLQNKINKAHDELNLTYNFIFTPEIDDDFVNGVKINKNIVINGNGSVISGNNLARIFNVTQTVTLDNITFVNASTNDNGAAIYSTGYLTVDNSVFDNNKITNDTSWKPDNPSVGGAAIYSAKGSQLTVNNTSFTNNEAVKDTYNSFTSGAVYVVGAGKLLIENSLFENNSAVLSGALTIEDFSQNSEAVKDSVFNNNTAWQGGAVNINEKFEKVIIIGSNFTGNTATSPEVGSSTPNGGAISIGVGSSKSEVSITSCVFKENMSPNIGGAIISNVNDTVSIDDCEFIKNNASNGGSAIFASCNMNINNSNFTENQGGLGTVYFNIGTVDSISNSNFHDNVAIGGWDVVNVGNLSLSQKEDLDVKDSSCLINTILFN